MILGALESPRPPRSVSSDPALSFPPLFCSYDTLVGEFVMTHPKVKVPDAGKIYSFNEGNYNGWEGGLQKYMDSLKDGAKWGGKPYTSRYIGSLVGDFHRTLLYGARKRRRGQGGWWWNGGLGCCAQPAAGDRPRQPSPPLLPFLFSPGGIYGYPGDTANPNGKLRLLYECAPMSFIMEQAGGKGSTGRGRVLDVQPDKVHQRVPLFVGSPTEVDYVESFLK